MTAPPVNSSLKTFSSDPIIRGQKATLGAGGLQRVWGFGAKWRILPASERRKFVALTGTLAVLSCLFGSCSEEQPKLASGAVVYEFLANKTNAEIADYSRERVNFGAEFTINKDKRAVLWEHPTAEVRFDGVAIPQNAVMQFGIGISPEVWDKKGDGVTFEITAVDEKSAKVLIFSKYIDPKNNSDDRKWLDQDVDLKDLVGQKVSFIFSTTYGPRGNGDYDWAGWSNPRVRLKAGG